MENPHLSSLLGSSGTYDDARSIDQKVEVLRICIEYINAEAVRKEAATKRRRNLLYGRPKLPVELLTDIILSSVASAPCRAIRLTELMKVSTRWWNIIRETPSFWTRVCVYSPGLEVTLQRSQALPLRMKVHPADDAHPHPSDRTMVSAGSLACSQAERWKTLDVSGGFNFGFVQDRSFPTLEIASLRPDVERAVRFCGGHRLKYLELYQVVVEWGLVELPALESLHITECDVRPEWAQGLMDTIAASPRLKVLYLAHVRSSKGEALAPDALDNVNPISSLEVFRAEHINYQLLDLILPRIHGEHLTTLCILGSHSPSLESPYDFPPDLFHNLTQNFSLSPLHMSMTRCDFILNDKSEYPPDDDAPFLITVPRDSWGLTSLVLQRLASFDTLSVPVHLHFPESSNSIPRRDNPPNIIRSIPTLTLISIANAGDAIKVLKLVLEASPNDFPMLKEIHVHCACDDDEGELDGLVSAVGKKRADIVVCNGPRGPRESFTDNAAKPDAQGDD